MECWSNGVLGESFTPPTPDTYLLRSAPKKVPPFATHHLNPDIINPLEYPDWDRFVLNHPRHSFFHSTAWAKVLSESYRYTPLYFASFDQDRIVAALPIMEVRSALTGRRGVSLPFTDMCPALCGNRDEFEQLLQKAIQHGKTNRWRYLELRDCGQMPEETASSTYAEHTLALTTDTDLLFSNLKSSTQRAIRKSKKENVEVSIDQSLDAVRTFYSMNCRTRKAHGLPPQPFFFFKKLHQHVLSKDHGLIVLAVHQGKAIAANLFLHMGKKALYKYGASDARYASLRGNNAVMWKAIEWYSKQVYESLSMGKTRSDNTGLMQFKNGWGCEERKMHYSRYDFQNESFVQSDDAVFGWHNAVFRRLPVALSRIAGSLLYRHVA